MRNSKKPPQKFILKDESGKTLEIPLEGSLGILASGYKGIMLWNAAVNASGATTGNADFAFNLKVSFYFSNSYSSTSSSSWTSRNSARAQNNLVKGLSNVIGTGSISNLSAGVVGPGSPLPFGATQNTIGSISETFGSITNDGNFIAKVLLPVT